LCIQFERLIGQVAPVQLAQLDLRARSRDQLHALDRLGHVIVGAVRKRTRFLFGVIELREHDHRQLGAREELRSEHAQQLDPAHHRHLDVGDQ
jgi:hypothetical protein